VTRCQESTPSIPETSPGDVEPKAEEPPAAEDEVEPVIKESEGVTPPVQGMTEI